MATEQSTAYKKVQLKQFPKTKTTSAEARYWDSFKERVPLQQLAKVTDVAFNPVAPHDFAVSASTRVLIYDSEGISLRKQISRFTDVAYSGHFRRDGKLLVAGGESSKVQVFDLESRSILRTFKQHAAPVHVTRFCSDGIRILSGSDDKMLKSLDVPTEKQVAAYEHKDYVRCAMESASSPDVWFSGCYDHIVRCWDTRLKEKTPVLSLDHGQAVQALLPLPGGGLVLSAGGEEIKVWDLLAGGKLVASFSNHRGNITSLILDDTGSRLLSGSLDRTVKVYDISTYEVTHSLKYTAPVLSLAISPDNKCLVAGLTDGTVSARTRKPKTDDVEVLTEEMSLVKTGSVRIAATAEEKRRKILTGTRRFFNRGHNYIPQAEDFSAQVEKKQALRPYDHYLKKFQYGKALDAAMQNGKLVVVASVLDELTQRAGLKIALSNRDERSLEPVLRFLVKYIAHPRYSQLLIDVANIVLDMYSSVLGQSIAVDELIVRLKQQIDEETQLQKHLLHLMGSLNLILAANTPLASASSLSVASSATAAAAAAPVDLPAIAPLPLNSKADSAASASADGIDDSESEEEEVHAPGTGSEQGGDSEEDSEDAEMTPVEPAKALRYEGKRSAAGKAPEVSVAQEEEEEDDVPARPAKEKRSQMEASSSSDGMPQPRLAGAKAGGKQAVVTASMNGVAKTGKGKAVNGTANGAALNAQKSGTKRKR